MLKGGKQVLFAVQQGAAVSGPGTCTPGPIDCEILALAPGQITVRFTTTQEALEKLLALGMAIGNDLERFEQAVGGKEPATPARSSSF